MTTCLPDDMLRHVISFLAFSDIETHCALLRTCRAFYRFLVPQCHRLLEWNILSLAELASLGEGRRRDMQRNDMRASLFPLELLVCNSPTLARETYNAFLHFQRQPLAAASFEQIAAILCIFRLAQLERRFFYDPGCHGEQPTALRNVWCYAPDGTGRVIRLYEHPKVRVWPEWNVVNNVDPLCEWLRSGYLLKSAQIAYLRAPPPESYQLWECAEAKTEVADGSSLLCDVFLQRADGDFTHFYSAEADAFRRFCILLYEGGEDECELLRAAHLCRHYEANMATVKRYLQLL